MNLAKFLLSTIFLFSFNAFGVGNIVDVAENEFAYTGAKNELHLHQRCQDTVEGGQKPYYCGAVIGTQTASEDFTETLGDEHIEIWYACFPKYACDEHGVDVNDEQ